MLTNASPAMPIWGGRTPFLGTSPLGIGVPGGERQPPLVLDMATAVAARGKIRRAAERGERIPEGWALDEHGHPTTDAARPIAASHAPLAGPKARAFADDGGARGRHVGRAFRRHPVNQYLDFSTPRTSGTFSGIPARSFCFESRISRADGRTRSRAKDCPLAEGFEEILMPGEREARLADSRRKSGVPVTAEDYEMLSEEESLAAKR